MPKSKHRDLNVKKIPVCYSRFVTVPTTIVISKCKRELKENTDTKFPKQVVYTIKIRVNDRNPNLQTAENSGNSSHCLVQLLF